MHPALLMMQLTSARAINLMLSTSASNKTAQYNYFGRKCRRRTQALWKPILGFIPSCDKEQIRTLMILLFHLAKHYQYNNLLKYIKNRKSRKHWQCYLLLLLLFYYIGINFGFDPQEMKFRSTDKIGNLTSSFWKVQEQRSVRQQLSGFISSNS